MENNKFITIKVWRITYRAAKILAAHLGVTLAEMLHRIILEEIERRGLTIE